MWYLWRRNTMEAMAKCAMWDYSFSRRYDVGSTCINLITHCLPRTSSGNVKWCTSMCLELDTAFSTILTKIRSSCPRSYSGNSNIFDIRDNQIIFFGNDEFQVMSQQKFQRIHCVEYRPTSSLPWAVVLCFWPQKSDIPWHGTTTPPSFSAQNVRKKGHKQ